MKKILMFVSFFLIVSSIIAMPHTPIIYEIQVGAFLYARNVVTASDKLTNSGFNVVFRNFRDLTRVIVTGIHSEEGVKSLVIDFDGQPVVYKGEKLKDLTLGYCISIHKSQGSEYPIVIMPFTMQFFVMLQRNLLYTGITRAKRAIILIGSKKAIGIAVKNTEVAKRNTGLAKRLTGMFSP